MRVIYRFWPRFYLFWANWSRFWAIYHLQAQVEDLERLCTWAQRKRLTGPRQHYQRLLIQTEMRLHSHAVRAPRLNLLALMLHSGTNDLKLSSVKRGEEAVASK